MVLAADGGVEQIADLVAPVEPYQEGAVGERDIPRHLYTSAAPDAEPDKARGRVPTVRWVRPERTTTPACGRTRCPQRSGDDRELIDGRRPSLAGTREAGRATAGGTAPLAFQQLGEEVQRAPPGVLVRKSVV